MRAKRLALLLVLGVCTGCATAPPRPAGPVAAPPSPPAGAPPPSSAGPLGSAPAPPAPAEPSPAASGVPALPAPPPILGRGPEPVPPDALPTPAAPILEGEGAPAPQALPVPEHPAVDTLLAEFSGPRRRGLADALRRGQRYLPMIREIFRQEGLPEDLAFLALVESHFRPDARSRAGAVGLWQFIRSTARMSGLRVDWWVDERLDPEASTRAAALHLRELYERFGDWNLALAAYNAGPGAVSRAISRRGSRSYWDLMTAGELRSETCRYVPKFYAAVAIARDPEAYGLVRPDPEPALRYDTVWVKSPVDLITAARLAGVAPARLRELNPALLRGCTPPGADRYPLRVPPGLGEAVASALEGLPPERRLSFRRYRVRPGDTLWGIGRRFGTRPAAIAELNGIRSPRALRPGAELAVPVPAGRARARVAAAGPAPAGPVHEVRRGESLWSIARQHGVTTRQLAAWNGLDPRGVIRPGQRLRLAPPGVPAPEARGEVYVVRRGDTLWGIARRYGVGLHDLLRWNRLPEDHVLRPGEQIRVLPDT